MKKHLHPLLTALLLLCFAPLMLSGCSGGVKKGDNCLTNPAFSSCESAKADGWYFDSYRNAENAVSFVKNAGPDGENALRLTLTELNDARLVQEVKCKRSTLYRFSVLCRTENIGTDASAVGANISVIGVFTHSQALSGDNGWTRLDFYGRTAANQTTLTVALRIGFYSGENSGTAWFTNASMTEIDASALPEGVTAASLENRLNTSSGSDKTDDKKNENSQKSTSIIITGAVFSLALLAAYALIRRFGTPEGTIRTCVLVLLIAAGLIIRIVYAMDYRGFNVDMNCFTAWGSRMLANGPFRFYSADYFCDYPPLYMLILAIPSAIINLAGLSTASAGAWLLLKSPAIICDILISVVLYCICKRKYPKYALFAAGAYLFNPAVIVDSASWGQADSVLMLFMLLAVYYMIKKKLWLSVIWYALGLLAKPQALMLAPVMLVGAITLCVRSLKGKLAPDMKTSRRTALHFLYSMLGILAGFVLISIAMRSDQPWYWLFAKYFGTMGSYRYATLSAFNLMGLLGGQWAKDTAPVLGALSYRVLGFALLAVVFAVFALLYYWRKQPKNRSLFLLGAWLTAAIFVLAPYMHERYLYPVLALLPAAFIVYGDRRIINVLAALSFTSYVNVAQVLYLHCEPNDTNGLGYFAAGDPLFLAGCALNVLMFIYFTYVVFSIRLKGPCADPALSAPGSRPACGRGSVSAVTLELLASVESGAESNAESNNEAAPDAEGGADDENQSPDADDGSDSPDSDDNSDNSDNSQSSPEEAEMNRTDKKAESGASALCKSRKSAKKAGTAPEKKRFLTPRDWLIMLGVTVVYAVITLVNLGSVNTPENYWAPKNGDSITADFGSATHLQRFYVNNSICDSSYSQSKNTYNGTLKIEYSLDGENWSLLETYRFGNGDMYRWNRDFNKSYDVTARYVRVSAAFSGMRINEMTFFADENAKNAIEIVSAAVNGKALDAAALAAHTGHDAFALFDEQATAVSKPSYYTGMYFDEIYHARTAYEMINGWRIYEWTHPPLGKAIMSLGIRIFGMNPFGWRFMGNLAGILMLPAMYCLGKLMFKKTPWATALMLLMTLDGMHFVQTRLATVDSYAVLFIILMYTFMYKYCTMSWNKTSLVRTLVPLGLCGISFGLGIACKWIGAYAGVGLAAIFFFTMYKRTREYIAAARDKNDPSLSGRQRSLLSGVCSVYRKNLLLTLLFCIGFFIIIPAAIYCASYGAYFDAPGNKGSALNTIWQNQKDMLSYHEGITTDTNYWQSKWYTWPIMWHPYWFYQAKELTGDAMGTISCMGNPLIWWFGLVSAIGCAVMLVQKLIMRYRTADPALRVRQSRDITLLAFTLTGLAANYGAWAFIPRSTFIYHYFASLPFIMIFSVYVLRQFYAKTCTLGRNRLRSRRLAAGAVIGFFAAILIIACMFYPLWSGVETSKHYVSSFLWWIPSFSHNGIGQGWHFYNN